jgi:hypothetical protein
MAPRFRHTPLNNEVPFNTLQTMLALEIVPRNPDSSYISDQFQETLINARDVLMRKIQHVYFRIS